MKTDTFFPSPPSDRRRPAAWRVSMPADAQNIKIGVVDMQGMPESVLQNADRAEKAVTDLATEKNHELDGRRADYESMTKKAAELDARARDTPSVPNPDSRRWASLQVLLQNAAKGQEIAAAEQKIRAEIFEARQKWKPRLVEPVREQVSNAATTQQGFDLVSDKSSRPRQTRSSSSPPKTCPTSPDPSSPP
ncbi:MAG: OmpH family outer membrane protein [Akkermansiaceae bacterium]|nr:OmpH family outer membrane protein [Akkermansiaceae bacterium]